MIYTLFGASGLPSGLILGGVVTQVGWHWTLLLPVPVPPRSWRPESGASRTVPEEPADGRVP